MAWGILAAGVGGGAHVAVVDVDDGDLGGVDAGDPGPVQRVVRREPRRHNVVGARQRPRARGEGRGVGEGWTGHAFRLDNTISRRGGTQLKNML